MQPKQLAIICKTSIALPLWFTAIFVTSMSQTACAQQTSTSNSTANANTEYSDCTLINFNDIDKTKLTKAELLQKMEQDFADNLNNSEKCMAAAASGAAGKVGAAGGSSGDAGDSAGGQGNTGLAQATSDANEDMQGAQQSASAPSKTSERGKVKQGSSAVCDTVKQGLDSATTDSERKHFQDLMAQYGC
ncbi:hypothetical protein [Arsukibacterium sp. MJ3]|uniref:hypothetical protein n=1 Tax=Arsukibacterium sp. MJ3 TaxID=1632859 RepID=UPI00069B7461|nr:hypothetical protein [Arsukibacterium sp. MJ3]